MAASANLRRLVAQCTQPHRSAFDENVVHALKDFLADPAGGGEALAASDAMYLTIIVRATAQPFSAAVVAKCLNLLKRFLLSNPPSIQMLEQLDNFCQKALAETTTAVTQHDAQGIRSSVAFVQSSIARLQAKSGHRRTATAAKQQLPNELAQLKVSAVSSDSRLPTSAAAAAAGKPSPSTEQPVRMDAPDLARDSSQEAVIPNSMASRWGASQSQTESAADEALLSSGLLSADISDVLASQRNAAAQYAHDKPQTRHTSSRPRLLFSYRPYSEQEALPLSNEEVLAVVDMFCDEDGQPAAVWKDSGLGAVGAGSYSTWSDHQHVCAAVVIKLVIDIWLQAGPAQSMPLALLLLQRAYGSSQPAMRCRAFDLLANLAVHGEMLYQLDSPEEKPGAAATPRRSRVRSNQLRSEELVATAARRLAAFNHWLRLLLFQMLALAAKENETEHVVWEAALGCLLHMCCSDGTVRKVHVAGLQPSVVCHLLHCSHQYGWSEDVRQQLVRVAVSLLYDSEPAGADSLLVAFPDDLAAIDGGKDAAKTGSPSADAPLLCQEALADFGGLPAVITQYTAAPSSEMRGNLFCVMFDQAVAQLQQADPPSASEVHTLGRLFAELHIADALQPLFRAGQPEFLRHVADEVCTYLDTLKKQQRPQQGTPDPMWDRLSTHVRAVLGVLQNMLLTHADTGAGLPEKLQPALQETLASVRNAHGEAASPKSVSQKGRSMDPAWTQLSDLLTSPDPVAAGHAQKWLLQLLVAAAQRQQQETPGASQQTLVGLLPQPPESGTNATGIVAQPQLAHLLRYALCNSREEADTAGIFAAVVHDFLQYIKLRLASTALQAVLSAGLRVSRPEQQQGGGATAGGAATSGTLTMTPRPGIAVVVEGGLVVTPRLMLATPGGAHEFRPAEGGAPWQTQHPVQLLTATLSLAIDWLTLAVPSCRNKAVAELAVSLTNLLGQGRPGSRLSEAASTPRNCLDGLAAVPQESLQDVDPALLLRMLVQIAPPHAPSSQPCGFGSQHSALQEVRVSLVLLLLSRISQHAAAYQAIGGEAAITSLVYDSNACIRLLVSAFLMRQLAEQRPVEHQRSLQGVLAVAQRAGDDKLLTNPYLQLSALLDLNMVQLAA